MLELTTTSRLPFVLMCIMGATLVTSAVPQPRITLTSGDRSEALTQGEWDAPLPSVALSDWLVSLPGVRDGRKVGLKLLTPARRESMKPSWPAMLTPGSAVRRSVVADDAAFRERSKLLTSMERQKWLNSYMQKLLVVNSP